MMSDLIFISTDLVRWGWMRWGWWWALCYVGRHHRFEIWFPFREIIPHESPH